MTRKQRARLVSIAFAPLTVIGYLGEIIWQGLSIGRSRARKHVGKIADWIAEGDE